MTLGLAEIATIAVGKHADLLLVGEPLTDLTHLRDPPASCSLPRARLDALLDKLSGNARPG